MTDVVVSGMSISERVRCGLCRSWSADGGGIPEDAGSNPASSRSGRAPRLALVAVAAVIFTAHTAHAQFCPAPDVTKLPVSAGKACSSQTGPCDAGLVCRKGGGSCRCFVPDPSDPSNPPGGPTSTTPPATVTPTTTRPSATTLPACTPIGLMCNPQKPPCCAPSTCFANPSGSDVCKVPTPPTTAPAPTVTTTTAPKPTTTSTLAPKPCVTEGKACPTDPTQACCSGLAPITDTGCHCKRCAKSGELCGVKSGSKDGKPPCCVGLICEPNRQQADGTGHVICQPPLTGPTTTSTTSAPVATSTSTSTSQASPTTGVVVSTTTTTSTAPKPTTTLPGTKCAKQGKACSRSSVNPLRCCDATDECVDWQLSGWKCKPAGAGTGPTVTTTTSPPGLPTTTTVPPQVADLLRPVRGMDISIRLARDQRTKWWNVARRPDDPAIGVTTANQPQRAGMYLMGVAKMMPEGLLYAQRVPACAEAYRQNLGNYETENTRLRVYYVDAKRNGQWGIFGENGPPDYSHTNDLGEDIRDCSLSSLAAKAACFASPLMTQDMLDWTDMRKEDGECRRGANLIFTIPPKAAENKAVAEQGFLEYNVPLPTPTPQNRAAMAHLMAVHHATDLAFCEGRTNGPAPGSVQAAVNALLATAISEEQRHAFLMIFTAVRDDVSWTRQQHCDWKMVQGFGMHAWGDCINLTGAAQWICFTRRRVSHETTHLIPAGSGTATNKLYRLGDHTDTQLTSQPSRTGLEWWQCLTGQKPGCGVPWVPPASTWRILAQ